MFHKHANQVLAPPKTQRGGNHSVRPAQVLSDITDDSTFERATNEGSREP